MLYKQKLCLSWDFQNLYRKLLMASHAHNPGAVNGRDQRIARTGWLATPEKVQAPGSVRDPVSRGMVESCRVEHLTPSSDFIAHRLVHAPCICALPTHAHAHAACTGTLTGTDTCTHIHVHRYIDTCVHMDTHM